MHWSGRGTEQDEDKALSWFLLAAEQEVPEAMYNVAKILLHKDRENNLKEARNWLVRSANAGYDTARDMLGDLDDDDLDDY